MIASKLMRNTCSVLAALSLPLLCGGAVAQQPSTTWVKLASTPFPVQDHALAYDRRRSVTWLYGGYTESLAPRPFWKFDGSQWTVMPSASAPPNRFDASMVYESRSPQRPR